MLHLNENMLFQCFCVLPGSAKHYIGEIENKPVFDCTISNY